MEQRRPKRGRLTPIASLVSLSALALVLGLMSASGVSPAADRTRTQEAGLAAPVAVVALAGTPHLWIAGEDGLFHWAGDTRALAGRTVDWGSRREVGLDELRRLRRGSPWLSAGLLKSGDPIYFVKWESEWPAPQLLHIQSIADVELFGIDAANYGALVLDEAAWRGRFGIDPATLVKGTLAAAAAAAGTSVPASGAAATVTVLSHSLLRGRGSLEGQGWVTGELRNNGPGIAHDPLVDVAFLNAAGAVIATGTGTSSMALAPGEVAGYQVSLSQVPAHERLEVRARASTDKPGYALTQGVPVSAVSFHLDGPSDGTRTARASGAVTNTGSSAIEGLTVVAWFLSEQGEVVDVTATSRCCPSPLANGVSASTLQPGQRAEFDVGSFPSSINAWVGSARSVKALAFARPAPPPGSTPAPTAVPPTPTPVPTPAGTLRARLVSVRSAGFEESESTFEITGANPRSAVRVQVTADPWIMCSTQGCGPTPPKVAFGPVDAGTADASGRLLWSDRHPPYMSSHYTFIDSRGSTVGVDVGNDFRQGQPTIPNLPR